MLKKNTNHIIQVVIWTVISAALFMWCNASFKFSYFFAEQLRMFEWDSQYALNTLLQPMGLVTYMADFITQFYIHPYVGALVAVLIFLIISLGLRGLLHSRPVLPMLAGLCFLPGIILAILSENQHYHIESSLAMINVILLFNIYVRLKNDTCRAIALILGGWFLYYTSGAGFISFVILTVIFELRATSWLRWGAWGLALICLFPIVGLYLHGSLGSASNIFTPFGYMNPRVPLDYVYYSWTIMLLVAIVFVVAGRSERRYSAMVVVSAVLLQIGVTWFAARYFYQNSFNKKNYIVMEADYHARREEWKQLINCTLPHDKNLFTLSYRNYALARAGVLANTGLSFPQTGLNGLIVPFNNAIPVMLLHTDFNYAIGSIALAQRYAFETMVQSRNMGAPRMLVRLVQTNLILGAYEVAEKYIVRLEKTLYYKYIAHYYRQFLYNDKLVESDSDLGGKRKGIKGLDGTIEKLPTLNSMYRTYKCNPQNRVLFQYLALMTLLEKDLPSLKMLLDIAAEANISTALPLYVQEGMVMYYSEEPDKLNALDIDPVVYNRFADFVELFSASKQSQQAYNELHYKYKNTVWYYFLFKK